jgi:predicted Zn-dependent protease with MMP-like domain
MRETPAPSLRAAALVAFLTGVGMLVFNPPTFSRAGELLALLVGAVGFVLMVAWATVMLIGKEIPEREFRRIVERSEALAAVPPAEAPPSEFDEIVVAAIDELPREFLEVLEKVPILVSHLGREHHAYGLYVGDTVARDNYRDHIVIYQDTIERDFGHDPALLRAQVRRTLRHEIAHHLGWGEHGVRELGL